MLDPSIQSRGGGIRPFGPGVLSVLLIEPDYLPQSSGPLFPGPWLVFAPHPDDETYGMGGSIAAARAAGIAVRVVVVTDGALGGVPDVATGDGGLVGEREREVGRALAALGGTETAFWREPDRGLRPDEARIARAMAEISQFVGSQSVTSQFASSPLETAQFVAAQAAGGTAFFPSLLEPHPDHRATALLVWEALRRLNFPLLPVSYDISVQSASNRLLDITPWLEAKRAAMAVYASQEAQRPYADRVLALNRSRSWSLPDAVAYAESFYAWAPEDATLAQMLGRLHAQQLRGLVAAPGTAPEAGTGDPGARIVELEAQLDEMRRSRSWRLTAPLRALVTRLRGGR
ncbi:MAG: PIG-L deacetylase family protein [Rhodocyclaceae bacterium]